ncbi:hypothetical protein VTO42DRAFT_4898 [Malbranchea cinnamomea]
MTGGNGRDGAGTRSCCSLRGGTPGRPRGFESQESQVSGLRAEDEASEGARQAGLTRVGRGCRSGKRNSEDGGNRQTDRQTDSQSVSQSVSQSDSQSATLQCFTKLSLSLSLSLSLASLPRAGPERPRARHVHMVTAERRPSSTMICQCKVLGGICWERHAGGT